MTLFDHRRSELFSSIAYILCPLGVSLNHTENMPSSECSQIKTSNFSVQENTDSTIQVTAEKEKSNTAKNLMII